MLSLLQPWSPLPTFARAHCWLKGSTHPVIPTSFWQSWHLPSHRAPAVHSRGVNPPHNRTLHFVLHQLQGVPAYPFLQPISGRHLCPQVRAVWWWLQNWCRCYCIIILWCCYTFPLLYGDIDKDINISLWLTSAFRVHKELLYRGLAYPAY